MKQARHINHLKRILLADADAQALEAFRQAMGEGWEVTAVANGTAALELMAKQPCDVVVADLDLAEVDGGDLLNRIQEEYPKAIRFILARETDRERMVKQVLGAHQFIGKPLDVSTLKSIIDAACALERWVPRNSIRELVRRIRTLPTLPTLYLEVQGLLKSQDATTEEVGAVIAKDMAMMTKLLQVINSAWFGASRKITDPAEAVGILGFETVSSMVMTIKLLGQYDKVKPVYFSIDRLWRHSTNVAQDAKQIALLHTGNSAIAQAAFTGGLLHDLGKVVLASNFDEQYSGAQSLARKQRLAPWDVEKEIFGASHGEIGAYLLGLWGMPLDVLEVAALHHHPSEAADEGFTALTAVHVANALSYEKRIGNTDMVVATLDKDYLSEIGVLDQVDVWREAVSKTKDFTKPTPKPKPVATAIVKPAAPTVAPAKPATLPKPATPAPTPAPAPARVPTPPTAATSKPGQSKGWIYAGVGAVVVAAIVGLTISMSGTSKPRLSETPKVSQNPPITKPDASPAQTPEHATSANASNKSVPTTPAPASVVAAAPTSVVEKVAAATVKPAVVAPAAPDIKLQGILYSANSPSAIINGKLVHPRDRVNGIQIVEIKPSSVVVEYQNQRRTLTLK